MSKEGDFKQVTTKDGRNLFYNFSEDLNKWIPHGLYTRLQVRKEVEGKDAIKNLIKLGILKRK